MINAMRGQIHGADARAATEGSAAMQQAKSLTVFDKADSDRIRQNLLEYVARVGCSVAIVASDQTYPKADNALHRLYTHTDKSSRATKRNRNSSSSL